MRKVIVVAAAVCLATLAACNLYFDDPGSSRGSGGDPFPPDAAMWPLPDSGVFPDAPGIPDAAPGCGNDGGGPLPDAGVYPDAVVYPDAPNSPDGGCCNH